VASNNPHTLLSSWLRASKIFFTRSLHTLIPRAHPILPVIHTKYATPTASTTPITASNIVKVFPNSRQFWPSFIPNTPAPGTTATTPKRVDMNRPRGMRANTRRQRDESTNHRQQTPDQTRPDIPSAQRKRSAQSSSPGPIRIQRP